MSSGTFVKFETASGLQLAADRYGDGPPVVLLHGGGQTRHAWGGVATALAGRGFRSYTVDLRGHGESGWSADGQYGLDVFAGDLRGILADIGQPAVLVGASLGGVAALLAAAADPKPAVISLVLVDVVSRMRVEGIGTIRSFMGGTVKGFASLDEAAEAVAGYLPHRKRPVDPSGLLRNLRRRADGRLYWHWDPAFITPQVTNEERDEAMESAARRLDVPVLILRGGNSELVTGESARAFAALFRQGVVGEIENAGHMVAGDQNDIFGERLIQFVEETFRHQSAPAGPA